jgi:hypothetical protein
VDSIFLFSEKNRQLSEDRIKQIANNLAASNFLILSNLSCQDYYSQLVIASNIGCGTIVVSQSRKGRIVYETLIHNISEHCKSNQIALPVNFNGIKIPTTYTQLIIELIQAMEIGRRMNDSLLKHACEAVYKSPDFPILNINAKPISKIEIHINEYLKDRHINEDAYQNLRTIFFL